MSAHLGQAARYFYSRCEAARKESSLVGVNGLCSVVVFGELELLGARRKRHMSLLETILPLGMETE